MMNIDIGALVPKFLMKDRNGRALAKALETGLNEFLSVCRQGVSMMDDPDSMPEWRLDELAWEYNIPYSYTADIEAKRGWVRDAYDLSRMYGTAEGIAKYLSAYFGEAQVLEAADYSGSAYHFKVKVNGAKTVADTAWALSAANAIKNVRSVLDEMRCDPPIIQTDAQFYAGAALYGAVDTTLENDEQPDISSESWLGDENGALISDERGVGLTG